MNLLSEEDDIECAFTINSDYAKRYDKWRKGEELQKLKDKYGNVPVESDESSSEEEDDAAAELTKDVEIDFFKTLASLKEKNPQIYDPNVKFFRNKTEQPNIVKKKEETMTMAQYQRNMLLEKDTEESPHINDLPLVAQEKAIKESFKKALMNFDDDDNENDEVGGLFKKKEKTKDEIANEEVDYKQWLVGQQASVSKEEQQQLKGLRDFWTKPDLDDGEKFLRDYILHKKYLNTDEDGPAENESDVDDDDEQVLEQETFERKFNFRFEEPDQDFIKRYPRTVEQSMRRKDEKRKKKRDELKERKQAIRAKKDEELKKLKALKREEIMEKIKKLKEVTGNDQLGFVDMDVDGDFDPEEHDKRMKQLFDDTYYEAPADEEKPEFPELDDELEIGDYDYSDIRNLEHCQMARRVEIENWDDWTKEENNGTGGQLDWEDPNFNMDCDYDPKAAAQKELVDNSRTRKKRRQSKFAEAAGKSKPIFDPKDKSFEKYLDEYYSLDYEDLIGDIPCRFKYRKTVPNDFGLTIEEILAAPDKELNSWVSSKKCMQRRPEHIEMYDVKAYRKKALNMDKKRKCLPSIYAPIEDESDPSHCTKANQTVAVSSEHSAETLPKKKKKDKKPKHSQVDDQGISNPVKVEKQFQSTGIPEKKKKCIENRSTSPICEKRQPLPCEVKENKVSRKNSNKSIKKNVIQFPGQGYTKSRKIKSKIKSLKNVNSGDAISEMSDARLKSFGLNPKKIKNKLKYGHHKH